MKKSELKKLIKEQIQKEGTRDVTGFFDGSFNKEYKDKIIELATIIKNSVDDINKDSINLVIEDAKSLLNTIKKLSHNL